MKRSVSFITFLSGIIFLLSIIQVIISNRLSTTGIVLGKLQDTITEYKKENLLLSEKILLNSSYDHISATAVQVGFIESTSRVFVTTPLPLALRQ